MDVTIELSLIAVEGQGSLAGPTAWGAVVGAGAVVLEVGFGIEIPGKELEEFGRRRGLQGWVVNERMFSLARLVHVPQEVFT